MKYRITLQGFKISDPDLKIVMTAVSANNAREIAVMRYKGRTVSEVVRLGKQLSTLQTMNNIRDEFVSALDEGNRAMAERHEKAFYSIILSLQNEMDVVAFNMAKKCLPNLPPMGR